MSKTANINVRVEPRLKKNVEQILDDLGLSLTAAINIFLNRVEKEEGIPFKITKQSSNVVKRREQLAKAINSTGAIPSSNKIKKITSLYANGDIDYEVAMFAIKKEVLDA